MRVYIPFKDGSSVSFDGENFTIHKTPKDINAVDNPEYSKPCKAESAWNFRWEELVHALEKAYKTQAKLKKSSAMKKIYKP